MSDFRSGLLCHRGSPQPQHGAALNAITFADLFAPVSPKFRRNFATVSHALRRRLAPVSPPIRRRLGASSPPLRRRFAVSHLFRRRRFPAVSPPFVCRSPPFRRPSATVSPPFRHRCRFAASAAGNQSFKNYELLSRPCYLVRASRRHRDVWCRRLAALGNTGVNAALAE